MQCLALRLMAVTTLSRASDDRGRASSRAQGEPEWCGVLTHHVYYRRSGRITTFTVFLTASRALGKPLLQNIALMHFQLEGWT